jgi:phosphoribosylglycinamide formyltransferase-1
VHHVTKDLDAGEIIIQQSIKIEDNDTVESLSSKVLKLEHQVYSEALKKIIN